VRVNLYATYRDLTGARHLELEGATVGEVLARLLERHPELESELFEAEGVLSERVSVFLNGRDVRYLEGLATPVGPDDVLDLFPPVAGGAEVRWREEGGVRRAVFGALPLWLLAAYLGRWGASPQGDGAWRLEGAWVRARALAPRRVGSLRIGRTLVEVGGPEAAVWSARIARSALRGGG